MKRSDRMARLHRIHKLKEELAAARHADARARNDLLQAQLDKLQDYWREYSASLEVLKKSTSCAGELLAHHRFLGKLDEAITQQRTALEKCKEALETTGQELVERGMQAKAIDNATAGIREQEQISERRKIQKEVDELVANNY